MLHASNGRTVCCHDCIVHKFDDKGHLENVMPEVVSNERDEEVLVDKIPRTTLSWMP